MNNLGPAQQLGTLTETAQNAACLQTYEQRRCEEFKKTLEPEDQSKVITCSDRDPGFVSLTSLLSCGGGAVDFVVDTATGVVHLISELPRLPQAVMASLQRAGEFGKKCEEDKNFRASLFESVAPLYAENERKIILEQTSCDALLMTVRAQTANGINDIAQKVQLQERFKQRYPNGERPMPDRIQLTSGEKEFQRLYMAAADEENARLKSAFAKIWNQVQTELACYNSTAKVEYACSIIAESASTALTGGALALARRSATLGRISSKIRGTLNAEELAAIRKKSSVGSSASTYQGQNPTRSAARVGMTIDERANTIAATSRMQPEDRLKFSEEKLGRKLSEKDQSKILQVHEIGKEELRTQGRYSTKTLAQKRRELVKSGLFSDDEINKLMRLGITGDIQDSVPRSAALQKLGALENSSRISNYFQENGDFTRLKPGEIRDRFEGKLPDSVIAHMSDATLTGKYNEGLRGKFSIRSEKNGVANVEGTLYGADNNFYYLRSSKDGDLAIPRQGNSLEVVENWAVEGGVSYTQATGKDLVGATIREVKQNGRYGSSQKVNKSSQGGSVQPGTYYDQYFDDAVKEGSRFEVHQPGRSWDRTPRVNDYEQIRPGSQMTVRYEAGSKDRSRMITIEGRYVGVSNGSIKIVDKYGRLQKIPNTLDTVKGVSVSDQWIPAINTFEK